MKPGSIGFVILSHEGAAKLTRLIGALRREYPNAPIAIHHDFSQCRFDRNNLGEDILWVEDWLRTGWAKWSVVDGALRAFALLHARTQVTWFVLLSASDYPIRKGADLIAELTATRCDAFVDARPLMDDAQPAATLVGEFNPKLDRFGARATRMLKRRFYLSPQLWLPVLRFTPKLRIGKLTWRPPIEGNHPFGADLGCFYGDHWFMGNRDAIGALLDPSPTNLRLRRYFRNRTQPDEGYYATVLANTPGMVICRNNRRFAEWEGGSSGPVNLTSHHLPDLLSSDAFFARKFDQDSPVLDELDAMLTS